MPSLPVLSLTLALAAPTQASQPIIGLLTLPEVFGEFPCDRFTPQEVRLYPAPDSSASIGAIRVERNSAFPPGGGCEGLRVAVHRQGTIEALPLPTLEYGYETPAAIVLRQRGRWFEVRLSDGAAWVHASGRDEYLPLRQLLAEGLTYLTGAWDGRLGASPGAPASAPAERGGRDEWSVRVTDLREIEDVLWVEVELLSDSPCTSIEDPSVRARGWLPAHAPSGELNVWFYSRGC